jgi:DNA-binding PucR family transcriptional regulator
MCKNWPVTLAEVLRLPVLKSSKLLSDRENANDREVAGVAVIEVPVGEFIRPGEFVMSTGMNVGQNPRLLSSFVREVAAAGASALAIATGPHTPRIPKSVITAALRATLPMLELPWEIRFSAISEAILRSLIQEQTATRTRDDLVLALATKNVDEAAAIPQGKQLGFDLRRRFVGVMGKLSSSTQNQARLAESRCGKLAEQNQLQWLGAIVGDTIVGYLQVPRTRHGIPALLKTASDGPYTISWGVGRICKNFSDFQKSYEDARIACDVGSRVRGDGSITHVTDVLADRVLLNLRNNGDVLMLLDRYIKPLAACKRMPLLVTLAAFFDNDCNASETARSLSISRQSLLYRLSRIGALLHTDLHNSEQRFTICLALRLHKFQGDG